MQMPEHPPKGKVSRIEADTVPEAADTKAVPFGAEREAERRREAAAEMDRMFEAAGITAEEEQEGATVFFVAPFRRDRHAKREQRG